MKRCSMASWLAELGISTVVVLVVTFAWMYVLALFPAASQVAAVIS